MKLSSNLRKLMKQRDATTKSLAVDVGIPEGTIKTWLAGSAPRSLSDVRRVAQFLNVTFEYLVFGDELSLKSVVDRQSKSYEVFLKLRIEAAERDGGGLVTVNVDPDAGDFR